VYWLGSCGLISASFVVPVKRSNWAGIPLRRAR
jgi:hypothetical protein